MNVQVETCWSGGEKFSFRLTLPNGERLVVASQGQWHRNIAGRTLDTLEESGYTRRNIRFKHV